MTAMPPRAWTGRQGFTLNKEKRMNTRKWFLVMALFAASVTAGCHTMHGAGQDIERGGEKIQENAR